MDHYSIGIKKLEVHSPCGVYEEERKLGIKLVVSVTMLFPDVTQLPVSLNQTFDYAKLVRIVTDVCKQPHALMEQVAGDVILKLIPLLTRSCVLHMRIEKSSPVPNHKAASAFIEITEQLNPGSTRRQNF